MDDLTSQIFVHVIEIWLLAYLIGSGLKIFLSPSKSGDSHE